MIYDYVVTLRNDKAKYINTISVLLSLVSAVFFVNQYFRGGMTNLIFIVAPLIIIVGMAWNWYTSAKKNIKVFYRRILLVAGVAWFAMPSLPWIGLPLLVLAFLEKQAKFHPEIGFTAERVVFNTLFGRKFIWSDFNNIKLKDGLLTLDFKDNRLFQKQTIDDDDDADEDEFNEYCQRQLLKSGFQL